MRYQHCSIHTVTFLVLTGWCCPEAFGFGTPTTSSLPRKVSSPGRRRLRLTMGLYDTPLPPPVPPRDNDNEQDKNRNGGKESEEKTRGKRSGPDYMDQVKSELQDLLMADNFQELQEKRLADAKQQRNFRKEPSAKDGDWLPIQNPKPVDDEPWFTG